jgi:hypothetical protein
MAILQEDVYTMKTTIKEMDYEKVMANLKTLKTSLSDMFGTGEDRIVDSEDSGSEE